MTGRFGPGPLPLLVFFLLDSNDLHMCNKLVLGRMGTLFKFHPRSWIPGPSFLSVHLALAPYLPEILDDLFPYYALR